MSKKVWTDEKVEEEIARLLKSDDVKLAKKENAIKNRRRQYMYQLRMFEKRGKELSESGINMDNIEEVLFPDMETEE